MIIGISGYAGSGKDTVSKIIQDLTIRNTSNESDAYIKGLAPEGREFLSGWYIKKFADPLRQVVAILLGCDVAFTYTENFKQMELPECWDYWVGRVILPTGELYPDSQAEYTWPYATEEDVLKALCIQRGSNKNYQAQKVKMTGRMFLQKIGTDAMRNNVHPNIWVNALMSQYKGTLATILHEDCPVNRSGTKDVFEITEEFEALFSHVGMLYPNWVITDMRFPNEMTAVKEREGITIRVNRPFIPKAGDTIGIKVFSNWSVVTYTHTDTEGNHYGVGTDGYKYKSPLIRQHHLHTSETALDSANFDHTIDNSGTIDELVEKVKATLKQHKLIQ